MPVPYWKTKKARIEHWLEHSREAREWFDARKPAAIFETTASHVTSVISELVLNNWTIARSEIDKMHYQMRETSRERATRLQAKEKNA